MKLYICVFICVFVTTARGYTDLDDSTVNQLNLFAQVAYSTIPTIINTYELSEKAIRENIEGVFIECGVAAGTQIGAMSLACKNNHDFRKIYLFDSFEGIPLAGPNDDQQPGVGKIMHNTNVDLNTLLVSSNKVYSSLGGAACCSEESVKDRLINWKCDLTNMVFVKGWFQNTLPNVAYLIDKISLLRLDGDLYESTKVCLEYLYPKVSLGGYVIIDDFALPGCNKAFVEYCEKYGIKPDLVEIEGGMGPVFFKKT